MRTFITHKTVPINLITAQYGVPKNIWPIKVVDVCNTTAYDNAVTNLGLNQAVYSARGNTMWLTLDAIGGNLIRTILGGICAASGNPNLATREFCALAPNILALALNIGPAIEVMDYVYRYAEYSYITSIIIPYLKSDVCLQNVPTHLFVMCNNSISDLNSVTMCYIKRPGSTETKSERNEALPDKATFNNLLRPSPQEFSTVGLSISFKDWVAPLNTPEPVMSAIKSYSHDAIEIIKGTMIDATTFITLSTSINSCLIKLESELRSLSICKLTSSCSYANLDTLIRELYGSSLATTCLLENTVRNNITQSSASTIDQMRDKAMSFQYLVSHNSIANHSIKEGGNVIFSSFESMTRPSFLESDSPNPCANYTSYTICGDIMWHIINDTWI